MVVSHTRKQIAAVVVVRIYTVITTHNEDDGDDDKNNMVNSIKDNDNNYDGKARHRWKQYEE